MHVSVADSKNYGYRFIQFNIVRTTRMFPGQIPDLLVKNYDVQILKRAFLNNRKRKSVSAYPILKEEL